MVSNRSWSVWTLKTVSLAVLASSVVFGASWATFGSRRLAVGYLVGRQLVLEPDSIELGTVSVGEDRRASFRVTNVGRSPVTIVGGTTSCACTTVERLPMTVAPGQTRSLDLLVWVSPTTPAAQTIRFYTTSSSQPRIDAELTSHVSVGTSGESVSSRFSDGRGDLGGRR